MGQANTQQQSAGGLVATTSTQMRLSGVPLLVARAVWLALVIPSLGLTVASFPIYDQRLQRACVDPTTCNIVGALTAKGLHAMATLGISASGYAAFFTSFWAVIFVVWCGVGFLIFWRRSDDGMALLVAFFLVLFNTEPTTSALAVTSPILTFLVVLMGLFGQVSLWLFLLLFPNGRLVSRWMGLIIPFVILQAILSVAPPTSVLSQNNWPGWFNGLMALLIDGSIIVSQIYRYRRVSTRIERQQIKWVAFAITIVVAGFLVFGGLFNVVFPVVQQPDSPYSLIQLAYPLLLLSLPVCIGIAILRYRLWDIDLIIKRTLVYSILTAVVVGLYVLVVGYLGALFHTGSSLVISLLATGLVAVLFQPLRGLLQRGVNRLLYGQRDEPYTVITRLSRRLRETLEPEAVLSTIVETVAQALKLPYVAILWKQEENFQLAASYGTPAGEPLALPLVYQAETIGQLQLAPRAPGETFTPADVRLLDELARQAGLATHAVRMATDLQKARERLVLAREEERRRLRRDLHDGVGPTLASLSQRIDTASHLIKSDPDAAIAQLNNLKVQVRSTLADIRRVVYALRPPVLDELGLVSAIREHVTHLQGVNGLSISVDAPADVPELSAAVEVAAYRIALEALTNVERHAHARHCLVRLELASEQFLCLSISDDGRGLPGDYQAGVGIASMRERTAELGGDCALTAEPGGGTHVQVRLPLKS
jgi:signal transduction histidine kinase